MRYDRRRIHDYFEVDYIILIFTLRRESGGTDFDRVWNEYKYGFGNVAKDHWLGLENLKNIMASDGGMIEVRFDMKTINDEPRYYVHSAWGMQSEATSYYTYWGGQSESNTSAFSFGMTVGNGFVTKDRDYRNETGNW